MTTGEGVACIEDGHVAGRMRLLVRTRAILSPVRLPTKTNRTAAWLRPRLAKEGHGFW